MNGITTITYYVKEWWDRKNGNTYFSGRLMITEGNQVSFHLIPFQYGHGSIPEQEAKKVVEKKIDGKITVPLSVFCNLNDIAYTYLCNRNKKWTKKEVIQYGKQLLY
jgi:hypothetical protein